MRTTYYENGQKATEEYIVGGKYHRENGPAYAEWNINGQKSCEGYYIHGLRHRENGPAYTRWDINMRVSSELYYINGNRRSIEYFLTRGFKRNKCKRCNAIYLEK